MKITFNNRMQNIKIEHIIVILPSIFNVIYLGFHK